MSGCGGGVWVRFVKKMSEAGEESAVFEAGERFGVGLMGRGGFVLRNGLGDAPLGEEPKSIL